MNETEVSSLLHMSLPSMLGMAASSSSNTTAECLLALTE